jgi:SAM-dependent methyltransferase
MMSTAEAFYCRWFPGDVNHDLGYHNLLAAKLPKAGKILNLGCGDNYALGRYRTHELEVWGADLVAHPHLLHPDWFRLMDSSAAIPFADNELDVVTSYMVMEHVAEPAPFFREIARVLKPGGIYVGQSIHSLHYVTWIRRLFDLVPHGWVQRLVNVLYGRVEHDTFPTAYRLNRRGTIARAARAANLEWVDWYGYACHGYFEFSPLLFRLAVLLEWSLEHCHLGLGKIYFTVVLRKPRSRTTQWPTSVVRAA